MTLIPCTALTTELRRLTIMSRISLRFSGSTIYGKDFAFLMCVVVTIPLPQLSAIVEISIRELALLYEQRFVIVENSCY